MRTEEEKEMKPILALSLLIVLLPLGCSSTPTATERKIFDVSTNYVASGTNIIPIYVETIKTNWVTAINAGGSVVNTAAPGVGTLVSTGILGLLSIFLGIRNRQYAGQNTSLSQAAGTLAQIIETGREVLSKTPQGQQAANAFTAWMVTHQADTNTIAQITQIVKDSTDNEEAQKAADQILALIKT